MILFFDTETTGLPRNWNASTSDTNNWPRMVQLAYLLYSFEGDLIESKNFIVKPNGYSIPPDVSQVHGITTERALREGVDLNNILEIFQIATSKATILVAHNMQFDENIVGCEYYRTIGSNPLSDRLKFCTMKSAKIIDFCAIPPLRNGNYKWPNLSELHYKLFYCDFEKAHNASIDVAMTAKCFWELKNRGIIELNFRKNPAKVETSEISEHESPPSIQTISLRKELEQYCIQSNFKEIPLGAKAESIMFLEFKFKQASSSQNIDEELEFMREFSAKSKNNTTFDKLSEIQERFIRKIKIEIIEEHRNFSLFSDEKNKNIEDKIRKLEVFSFIKANDTKAYRDLMVHLYYYYLSKYEDFLPYDKKPKHMDENEKYEYLNISDASRQSHEKLNVLINNCGSDIEKIKTGDIPEFLYSFVVSCKNELGIIKNETGIDHKMYIDDSDKVVRVATAGLIGWIKSTPRDILVISIQGMKLGRNLLDVCNVTFNEIQKIETGESTKKWFNNVKNSFDSLKEHAEPGGCFIATMAYGDYNHPQVVYLREFRDNHLSKILIGKIFIKFYYFISPAIVCICKRNKYIVGGSRFFLNIIIDKNLKKKYHRIRV